MLKNQTRTLGLRPDPAFKLVTASILGIIIFFLPLHVAGVRTIPLDHMVRMVQWLLGPLTGIYALAMISAGAIEPWLTGSWKETLTNRILTLFKALGVVFAILALTGWGPAILQAPDMLPFLFEKLVIPVGLIVPIGGVFLVLLVGYGLMELLGVLLEPVMRPIWRTPGRSAVDAVASFVGSYSIGLLITDRVYRDGKYSALEAGIIATGFSTVSVTFMVIVAKTLDLMSIWNTYFWGALVITFLVTALTARLPPLSRLDKSKTGKDLPRPQGSWFAASWREGKTAAAEAPSLPHNLYVNGRDAVLMTIRILPTIMSVGLTGLLLAEYTPVFDVLGWIFYPIAALWQVADPLVLSQGIAASLAEMFLPALLIGAEAEFTLRFTAAVVSVSSILFFSASIPCILSTRIPLSVPQIVVIWLERTLLSVFLAIPMAQVIAQFVAV